MALPAPWCLFQMAPPPRERALAQRGSESGGAVVPSRCERERERRARSVSGEAEGSMPEHRGQLLAPCAHVTPARFLIRSGKRCKTCACDGRRATFALRISVCPCRHVSCIEPRPVRAMGG